MAISNAQQRQNQQQTRWLAQQYNVELEEVKERGLPESNGMVSLMRSLVTVDHSTFPMSAWHVHYSTLHSASSIVGGSLGLQELRRDGMQDVCFLLPSSARLGKNFLILKRPGALWWKLWTSGRIAASLFYVNVLPRDELPHGPCSLEPGPHGDNRPLLLQNISARVGKARQASHP